MARDNTREQTLLDQYWDADPDNRGYMSDELDESLRQTVDRFESEDDAPDPDAEFVDRLWTDLAGGTTAGATAAGAGDWIDDGEDEPTEPQFVAERQEDSMTARQQSDWRRRGRQIGELVAGVLVLALITGGLILAYQNLLGGGEGETPGQIEDLDGLTPVLSTAGAIPFDGDILERAGVASVEIGRFDNQDYALMFTIPGTQAGTDSGPVLQTVRLDQNGQHEKVGSLELDVPWTSSIGVAMGRMALVDDVLYLPIPAEERPGIWAVDVSDPVSPEEVSFVDIDAGFPTTVAASDDQEMLTVATFGGPLYFVDVSEAGNPDVISAWEAEMFGFHDTVEVPSIVYDEGHVYIRHYQGVRIVDFSEPADIGSVVEIENPDFDPSGENSTNGSSLHGPIPGDAWHDAVLVGDTAYVAAGDDGVLIFDVSDPTAPTETGQIERDDRTFRFAEADGFVYVLGVSAYDEPDQQGLDWTWSVDVLDVSEPESPEIVDRLTDLSDGTEDEDFLGVNTRHLVAGQDFLLTFGMSGSLVAHIDWVEPVDDEVDEAPTPQVDEPEPADDIEGLVPSPSPLSIFDQHGEILDGAELGTVQLARFDGQEYAFLLTFPQAGEDGEAYPTLLSLRLDAAGQHEVVASVELDVPWSGPMQFNMGEMAIVDDILYAPIPAEQWGIWSIDVSDHEAPAEFGFLEFDDDMPLTVVADGDVAVATGMFGNIYFFLDISDPAAPELAGQIEASELELHSGVEVPSLAMEDELLYIGHPRGLTIVDARDPANPEEVGWHENPNWEGREGVSGAGTETQVEIGSGDSQLDNLVSPGAFNDVAVSGDHAYVAAGGAGVLVFDVSDASNPMEVGQIERHDRTFRLAGFEGFVYALGVSSESDDPQELAWTWSIDVLDVSEASEPRIVQQLSDLVPEQEDAEGANVWLMSTVRQITSGQDFLLTYGRGGAYVAGIDWLEAGEAAIDDASTPQPEDRASDLPEQDPREVVIEMMAAFDVESWERLRQLTVEPFSEMRDEAVQYVYQPLRVPDRDGIPPAVAIDAWEFETFQQWALVYHSEVPVFRLVMVPDGDGWLHDPGPLMLAHAQVVDITGNPRDTTDAINPIRGAHEVDVHGVDDPDLASALSMVVDTGQPSIQFEDDSIAVGYQLELVRSEWAEIDVSDISWHAGGESGQVEIFWTDAMLESGGSRLVIPGNPEGRAPAYFGFRLEGAPADAETFSIRFANMQVSGVNLDLPTAARDIDEIELTASFERGLELAPDLDSLRESSE